ncbi:MAG: hypothetical protein EXS05_15930 [Planctomycetaceae bacterium]|nr:hypothetical protein [Planctomycetaceae bacterium]
MAAHSPHPLSGLNDLSSATTIRILTGGDEPALERFLSRNPDTSMFLRSNLRAAGIVDRGEPFQGTYVADVDSTGEVLGVVCRYWNGNLIYQAPVESASLARAADALIGKQIAGLLGPWDQTLAIRAALALDAAPTRTSACDDLYALSLSDLIVPPQLATGQVHCCP